MRRSTLYILRARRLLPTNLRSDERFARTAPLLCKQCEFLSPTPTRTADYHVLHQERSPAVVNCERSRLRRGKTTPAHFTSFVSVHGHSSLSSRSSRSALHHQFGLYLHIPTPPPPINTNVHPPATSSSHRDKGPCTSHQLAAEITLGATAEVQLNSATDSTSVPRLARLIRKRTRRARIEQHGQPIVRKDGATFDLPGLGRTSRPQNIYDSFATDAVPVATANDGSQRFPDASDGGTTADEPPTTDLWGLFRGWTAKHEHARPITTAFRGWISHG